MDRKFPRYSESRAVILENVELGFCQHATMVNFSGSGLCCKIDMEYKPGNKIFVKIEQWPTEGSGRLYGGKVQWCMCTKTDQLQEFHIGVKIESVKYH